MMNDQVAVFVSYIYVGCFGAAGEILHRWAGWSQATTRKLIHVGVGMWIVGTVLIFESWMWAVVPPASFVVLNYLSHRWQLVKSMDMGSHDTLGTVYFPLSFAVLIPLFWPDQTGLLIAALMPMTWGDAMAALVGEYRGNHKFRVLESTRSLEGSAAMLGVSFTAVWMALVAFQGKAPASAYVWPAIFTALVTTLAEAVSPRGTDNLSVPFLSAIALVLTCCPE